jgi:hypothetical protein
MLGVKFPQTFPLPSGAEFFNVGVCCSTLRVSHAVIGFCGEAFSFSDAILEKGWRTFSVVMKGPSAVVD